MRVLRFNPHRNYLNAEIQRQIQLICKQPIKRLPVQETVPLSLQLCSSKSDIDVCKTPIVMVHGLFGAKQNWSSVGRQLSHQTGAPAYALDMRNHGALPHASPHDYNHMAGDTIAWLEAHGKPAVLAGHLMGAKVAMLVALRRPDLVERLIVIDNSPKAQALDPQFTRDLLAMCSVEDHVHEGTSQAAVLRDVDKIMCKYEPDKLVRLFLQSNLRRPKRLGQQPLRFRIPVKNFVHDSVLHEMGQWPMQAGTVYEKPVLVMRGLQSRFVEDAHLREDFPEYFSTFRTVDFSCGHWLVSEQPQKFVEETVRFMQES